MKLYRFTYLILCITPEFFCRMLLLAFFIACTFQHVIGEKISLITTANENAYLEIKYETKCKPPSFSIKCTNGFVGIADKKHLFYYDDIPVYRIPVGKSINCSKTALKCICTQQDKTAAGAAVTVEEKRFTRPLMQECSFPSEPFEIRMVDMSDAVKCNDVRLKNTKDLKIQKEAENQKKTRGTSIHNAPTSKDSEWKVGFKNVDNLSKSKSTNDSKPDTNHIKASETTLTFTRDPLISDKSYDAVLNKTEFPTCKVSLFRPEILAKIGKRKIYISLTTSPTRLLYLHYTLASIDFSLVERIFIILPRYYQNNTSETYKIPFQLFERFPKLRILYSSKDPGPCLKLVGSCQWLQEQGLAEDSFVISIDDDMRYSPLFVDTYVILALTMPNSMIGGRSLTEYITDFGILPAMHQPNILMEPAYLLEGFAGNICPAHLVDVDLILGLCNPVSPSTLFSDDLMISWAMSYNNVPLYCIKYFQQPYFHTSCMLEEFPSSNINALKDKKHDNSKLSGFGGNIERYMQASQFLFWYTIDAKTLKTLERDEILKKLRCVTEIAQR